MRRLLACLTALAMACSLAPSAWASDRPEEPSGRLRALEAPAGAGEGAADVDAVGTDSDADAPDTGAAAQREDVSLASGYTARSIGNGGHGAVFDPVISPFDSKTMVADCDMGGLYVTHDEGFNWDVKSCAGRVWDIQADPSAEGTFYAGGSGLWRSQDNGDTWNLLWPDPEAVLDTPCLLNHDTTYYFTTDSYPNSCVVEAVCVDSQDSSHLLALASPAANYKNDAGSATSWRWLCESFDGGAEFACIAQFKQLKDFRHANFQNTRVFVEHGASSRESRVVVAIPDGIYEVDRSRGAQDPKEALSALYEAPEVIVDAQQVVDGEGAHYVVLEAVDEAAARAAKSRVALWHTTDFSDPGKRRDLTSELVNSLPRHFNAQRDRNGAEHEIRLHNAEAVAAPSLDRMYLSYRTDDVTTETTWQGANGLVTYDASLPEGSRFRWTYGLRLWWSGEDADARVTPDQNQLMARGHVDSSFTFFKVATDPRDARKIAVVTHTGLFYSPDIDADVGQRDGLDKVNLYPRYAVYVDANPPGSTNVNEGFMRSTGLEVTVAERVATDPFDRNHLLLAMDDAGIAQSFDGGATWSRRYTTLPQGVGDCCFDVVFDEGRRGVVYGLWHSKGGATTQTPSQFLANQSRFAYSADGGDTWSTSYSSGLPDTAGGVKMAVVYPRDGKGNITGGNRVIYIAAMGYGFFASRDSGRTFKPMNAGIPTHSCTSGGVTVDAVWARDILVTGDGRIFGMTQYSTMGAPNGNGSTTYHSTQEEASFGNVWEWDAKANGGAGTWKRLPFNSAGDAYAPGGGLQVRQPRAMCYDEGARTLYVAGVGCVGYYLAASDATLRQPWTNFGGGLFAYMSKAGAAVGSGSVAEVADAKALLGEGRNMTGVGIDACGRLWIATEDGDVYVREGRPGDAKAGWTQVCGKLLRLCHSFDMAVDGTVYFTTHGAGAFRIAPTAAKGPTTVKLPDAKLYAAVCKRLDAQGLVFKRNAAAHEVTLSAEQLARVTSLDLSGYDFSSAEGLGAFTGLKSLVLGRLGSSKAKATLSKTAYVQNGTARKPSVTVTCGGRKLKLGVDYTVAYSANKNVGTAKVTVKGKGSYTGARTLTFKINPRPTAITKLAAAKRGFTAKWKKQAAQTTGYQLQYGLKSNFKSAKTLTVPKVKTVSRKVSKLGSKKRYYVRVRTYRKIGKTTFYSTWSKAKSVKVA